MYASPYLVCTIVDLSYHRLLQLGKDHAIFHELFNCKVRDKEFQNIAQNPGTLNFFQGVHVKIGCRTGSYSCIPAEDLLSDLIISISLVLTEPIECIG